MGVNNWLIQQKKSLRICFVGDSFVNGTGDPSCLGWAGRICVAAQQLGHDITYYNLGIRRQTSTDIAHRWKAEVSCRLPEGCDGRIVFSFGVNDTVLEHGKVRVEVAESVENTRQILSGALHMFPTIMVGPSPGMNEEQNLRIAHLSDSFARVCDELGVPYLPVLASLQQSGVWSREAAANDSAHPRAAGYAALADLVQNWSAWLSWFR
jgi:lysophospholipase L1-like esterase